ncbi:MAG: hypothetical protein DI566_03290 [Microbacterium sp.]|nr:MAG: hypothetical protein DI566_03290 [Microbacterium sp.]
MPRQPTPLPDALTTGPFWFREAIDFGVPRRRLAASDLTHPHRGVYAPAGADDQLAACESALPLLGEDRRFSHLTAARLWGMPLPFEWRSGEPLHVLTLPGAEPLRRSGIVGWESADRPGGALVGPFPVVAAADVWAQLSVPGATGRDPETGRRQTLSRVWLVAVGDYLLTGPRAPGGKRTPLCSRDELVAAAITRRGKRGAKALTWALERVRAGAQSPRESMLRLALVDRGLPEPAVQPPIATSAGIRHPDLGYLEERVLIEYQGDHHRTDPAQWREDLRRQQFFEDAGYRVIAVTIEEFADDCFALALRIRRALRGRSYGA